jgi:hypothetical protein
MTALDDLHPASAELVFAALDYAVENARISEEGFTPFALFESPSGHSLTRFVSGDGSNLAECLAAGREALRAVEPDVTCVALAWDGYYTHEGQRSEAVFVEAYEIGRVNGLLLVQRYAREAGGLAAQGNPRLIGEPEPLVKHQRTSE